MTESLLLALAIGIVFISGALTGWRGRGVANVADAPRRADDDRSCLSDTVLALHLRNQQLRSAAEAAQLRAASLEDELSVALDAARGLESEVERLAVAADEANAEAAAAAAWARKVWREQALRQGADRRHPSAATEERATPPAPAPRGQVKARQNVDQQVATARRRSAARWN